MSDLSSDTFIILLLLFVFQNAFVLFIPFCAFTDLDMVGNTVNTSESLETWKKL